MSKPSMLSRFLGIGQGTAAATPPPPAQPDPDAPVDADPNNANDPDNQTARQQLRQNMQNVIDADAADEAEMSGDTEAAQARGRERARCAAIFGSTAAAGRHDLAGHLAFNTNMGAGRAVAALAAAPEAAQPGGLDAAMAGYAGQRPGAAPLHQGNPQASIDSVWDNVAKKVNGGASARRH